MQVFFPNGTCPKEFTDNGMPCTCPFKTSNSITLNQDRLSLPDVKPSYTWLTRVRFSFHLCLSLSLSYFLFLALSFPFFSLSPTLSLIVTHTSDSTQT